MLTRINLKANLRTGLSFFLFLSLLSISFSAYAEELSGKEIVDKVAKRNQLGFESGRAQISLKIKDSKGSVLDRKLDIKSKEVEGKNRTLVTILAPKELQNQAFLFTENASKKNDIWMYLPAFKITRRVEGSQKDASFLGSHFTYADLQAENTSSGTYTREKDEKVAGSDVYVVTSLPEKKNSGYDKVVMYVRKSDFIPIKTLFYQKGALKKTLYITKIGKTSKGSSYAKQLVLKVPDGGQTTIDVNSIDESPIPDTTFSKEQLGK